MAGPPPLYPGQMPGQHPGGQYAGMTLNPYPGQMPEGSRPHYYGALEPGEAKTEGDDKGRCSCGSVCGFLLTIFLGTLLNLWLREHFARNYQRHPRGVRFM